MVPKSNKVSTNPEEEVVGNLFEIKCTYDTGTGRVKQIDVMPKTKK